MTVTYNPLLLQNLNNPTTAVTTINNNETAVSSAFQMALNTSGDTMLGTLNMNNNALINLPAPASANAAARLVDIAPAGTTLISALTYNNIQSLPANTILGNPTGVTANATAEASITVANAVFVTSVGTQALNASTATITGVASVSSLTASTLFTLNATVASITETSVLQFGSTGLTAAGFYAASPAASAGTMGEYITGSQAAPIALANNSPSVVLAITLTPGDWDVWGSFNFTASVGATYCLGALCLTPNTLSAVLGIQGQAYTALTVSDITNFIATLGPVRQQITSNTNYYINVQSAIASGSMSCNTSTLNARRWR
jgi:hypothetical protein